MQINDLSVIYVEDDPNSREILGVIFTKLLNVSDVTILEDSTEFPNLLATYNPPPDLAFLDVHVRPYSGYDMLNMIREMPTWSGVKVVALTASVMANEVNELQEAGFHSLISKPLNPDTFIDYLHQILADESVWVISWD